MPVKIKADDAAFKARQEAVREKTRLEIEERERLREAELPWEHLRAAAKLLREFELLDPGGLKTLASLVIGFVHALIQAGVGDRLDNLELKGDDSPPEAIHDALEIYQLARRKNAIGKITSRLKIIHAAAAEAKERGMQYGQAGMHFVAVDKLLRLRLPFRLAGYRLDPFLASSKLADLDLFEPEGKRSEGDITRAPNKLKEENDKFVRLLAYARDELKGQGRAVVEALCASNGEMTLANLSLQPGVGWNEHEEGFKGVQRRYSKRLKNQGWKLYRHSNTAKLKALN